MCPNFTIAKTFAIFLKFSNLYDKIKGIVSQDFEVCFLVPLDSSDIATPSGAGSFFFKVDFVSNF
jgi:hypothetical protein